MSKCIDHLSSIIHRAIIYDDDLIDMITTQNCRNYICDAWSLIICGDNARETHDVCYRIS